MSKAHTAHVFASNLKTLGVDIPEETIKFEIIANVDEVVKIVVESALPEDVFENIKSL